LECSFVGVPTPTALWYKGTGDNRIAIPGSNADYVVIPDSEKVVLFILDPGDEDAGTYTCEATNTMNNIPIVHNKRIEVKICSK